MDVASINQLRTAPGVYAPQEGTATAAAAAGGSAKVAGMQATVEVDVTSMINDSLEELSSMFEEKTTRTMGERRLGEKRNAERIFDAKVEFWSEKFRDLPNPQLLQRLLRMLSNAGSLTLVELMRQLRGFSGDPSHQFAALDILEAALRENADTLEGQQLIRQCREELEKQDGAAIRAGINLADAMNAAGEPPERLQQLRDLYRSEILGFSTPQECFRSLVSRGSGTLGASLEFLMASCNVDMEAASPSTPPERLRQVMLDLQCVNVLRHAMERFERLSARMFSQFQQPLALSPEALMGRVMDMTEATSLESRAMMHLVAECGVRQLLAKLDFMRESLALFRTLSSRLFREEAVRQMMLDAAQEYLDDLVAEDENRRAADEERQQQQQR